jgi:hypothetical protein
MISAMVSGASSVGLFSSRAFVPAFAAALLLRFGPHVGIVHDLGLLATIGTTSAPAWFTHDVTLWVLGILAGLEVAANKSHDARMVLAEVDHWGKPGMAALTYLGILRATDRDFAGRLMTPHAATLGQLVPAAAVAVGTYYVASWRKQALQVVHASDHDDSTGLQRLLSWVEESWAFFGIMLAILFPILMLILVGLVVGFIALLKFAARRMEERSKVACGGCQALMYRSALQCPDCRAKNPRPMGVNWLGTASTEPANVEELPFALAAKRRCPRCATRLTKRRPEQRCERCGHAPFGEPEFVAGYDERVRERVGPCTLVCFLLGFIPVIGLIAGIVYYRMALCAAYRSYIPWGKNFFMRWTLRIFFVFLFWLQPVPLLGWLIVPLMAWISHKCYRRLFLNMAEEAASRGKGAIVASVGAG